MSGNSEVVISSNGLIGFCNLDENCQKKVISRADLLKQLGEKEIKVCNVEDFDNKELPIKKELFVLVKSIEIHERSFWLVNNRIFKVQDIEWLLLRVFGVYGHNDVRGRIPKAEEVKMCIGFEMYNEERFLWIKR